jgi:hypothetical protein
LFFNVADNVKFVCLISTIRLDRPSRFGNEFREMEDEIERSGLNYSFIRCGLEMQTLFLFAPDLRKGVLPLPLRNGRVALLNVRIIDLILC